MKIKFLMSVLDKDSIYVREEIHKPLENLLQLNVRNAVTSLQQLCDTLTNINVLAVNAAKRTQQRNRRVKLKNLGLPKISYPDFKISQGMQFPAQESQITEVNLLAMEPIPFPSFSELTNKNIDENNINTDNMKIVQTNTDTIGLMEPQDSLNKLNSFCVSPHRPLEVVECTVDQQWSPTPTQLALNDFIGHETASIDSFIKTQNVPQMTISEQNLQEMIGPLNSAELECQHQSYQFQQMGYDQINNNQNYNTGYPANSIVTYAIMGGETQMSHSSQDPFIDAGQWQRHDDHRV
jgi:hypothetical protein